MRRFTGITALVWIPLLSMQAAKAAASETAPRLALQIPYRGNPA